MKLGKLTDYATVILTEMARAPEQRRSAVDLAQRTHVAAPTVSKLLRQAHVVAVVVVLGRRVAAAEVDVVLLELGRDVIPVWRGKGGWGECAHSTQSHRGVIGR